MADNQKNTRGSDSEKHAEAGRKGGEAKAQSNQGGNSGGRGFAGMDEEQKREIARKGGKASHEAAAAMISTPKKRAKPARKGGSR